MKPDEQLEAEFEARFEAKERARRMNYKICCMNGLDPYEIIDRDFYVDLKTKTITGLRALFSANGRVLIDENHEVVTEGFTMPIIALPHELRNRR